MSESQFGIDASAFRRAADALENNGFAKLAGPPVAMAIKQSAYAVRRNVRKELKPHKRTGRLHKDVRTKFQGAGLLFIAKVKSTGPVAHLIIGGVKPHTIGPPPFRRGSATVLPIHEGGSNGAVVAFSKVVEHRGFGGDPYFHRGVQRAAPEINELIRIAADAMCKELAKRMSTKK